MPSHIYNTDNFFPQEKKEYVPLRYDMGDTRKIAPMTKGDYEAFMEDMEE